MIEARVWAVYATTAYAESVRERMPVPRDWWVGVAGDGVGGVLWRQPFMSPAPVNVAVDKLVVEGCAYRVH